MSDSNNTSAQIELEEFLETRVVRRHLLPRAVLVGICSGCIAVSFRVSLQYFENFRHFAVRHLPASPILGFFVVGLIAAVGTWIAMMLGRLDLDAGGSGIPQMKAVLEGHLKMNWIRIIWVKFSGALVALGSGLALGREGPTVQMGGAIGKGVGLLTGSNKREQRALTAAGAGAGLAAAFNAPLAGVTFVLEELQRDFQPIVFVASLLCAAIATVISRVASGQFPVFHVPHIDAPSMASLPLFVVIGIVGGLLGVLFNKGLLSSLNVFSKLKSKSPIMMAIIVGLAVAVANQISPSIIGGGHTLTELAIHNEIPVVTAMIFFGVRLVLIHICYSTNVPGGIFAPLLSLGALLGLVSCQVTSLLLPGQTTSIAACAVAGMCAMFAGVVRAPLTGVILIGEMTGSYDLLLPLLVTSFAAYAVAEGLADVPIYEALLQRLSMSRGFDVTANERRFVEIEIQPNSTLNDTKVKDANLPEGVLLVLCSRAGKEFVPNGNTLLSEHMKVSIVTASPKGLHDFQRLARPAVPGVQ